MSYRAKISAENKLRFNENRGGSRELPGCSRKGEFLFGRENQSVPTDDREVEKTKSVPGGRSVDTDTVDRILKLKIKGEEREGQRYGRTRNSERAAIWTLHGGTIDTQENERKRLHGVGSHCAEDGHVEERSADGLTSLFTADREPDAEHDRETED